MSYIGTNKVGKMYLGDVAIGKAYLGSDLVFSASGATPSLPYDAKIEYLQSTGTQYIDTGIKPSTNFKCEIKAQCLQNNNRYDTMLGCYDGTNFGAALAINTSSVPYIQLGGGSSYATSSVSTGTALHIYTTQLLNNTLSINVDGTTNTASYSGSLPNMSMYLFGRKRTTTAASLATAKIYYCKIWNGGTLVRDFIPVRIGQVGYMYDRVSNQLFGNSGTGDFTLGNDITLPYESQYEYLESTGTQWIDTDIVGDQDIKIEAKFSPSETGKYVYGCRGDNSHSITFFASSNSNLRFGNQTVLFSSSANTNYTVVQNKTKITVNGTDFNYGTVSDFVTPDNLYMFRASVNNTSFFKGRFYYMKIWSGSTLVRDLIPVRDSDLFKYMYDRVSGRLFPNAGTGNFTLGNVIS